MLDDRHVWTKDQETRLLTLHAQGFETDLLAERFAVSRKAIRAKLQRLGKQSKENA